MTSTRRAEPATTLAARDRIRCSGREVLRSRCKNGNVGRGEHACYVAAGGAMAEACSDREAVGGNAESEREIEGAAEAGGRDIR